MFNNTIKLRSPSVRRINKMDKLKRRFLLSMRCRVAFDDCNFKNFKEENGAESGRMQILCRLGGIIRCKPLQSRCLPSSLLVQWTWYALGLVLSPQRPFLKYRERIAILPFQNSRILDLNWYIYFLKPKKHSYLIIKLEAFLIRDFSVSVWSELFSGKKSRNKIQ